ncbi:MAG: hypothetical protein Q4E05_05610 [Pseudoclavibacter sp.]|nr:hypothetical protein [Pseudoclavibacter sp.]
MTPRPARRRWRRILLTLALILVAGMVLTLGLFDYLLRRASDPLDVSLPAGDDTPFRERQALEDYAATVPPAVVEFQERLTRAGSGEWSYSLVSYQFNVGHCTEPDKTEGSEVDIDSGRTGPLPVEQVAEIGNGIFIPLGFQPSMRPGDDGKHYLAWIDWHNGGHIGVYVNQSDITMSGGSECRPSRDPDRVRFELQALVPLPSESPAEPTSSPSRSVTVVDRTETGRPQPQKRARS